MVAVQIEHVCIIIDKPFSDVAAALESQLRQVRRDSLRRATKR